MQYGCGPGKIKRVLKCTDAKAKAVYSAYHTLYSGLAKFAEKNKQSGILNGYVTGAFGLRLRTPLLKRQRPGERESQEVGSEARSSSNMVTQSWGMLMNRAFIEFDNILSKSPYKSKVRLVNTIHDAVYLLVKDEPEVIQWVNTTLVKCMEWQEDIIKSDEVKMTAEVDFGYSWKEQHTLHNNATLEECTAFSKAIKTYKESNDPEKKFQNFYNQELENLRITKGSL